jgi:4-amino-4-deoxy-L-arabinose transferase-like glycosyltransferase
LRIKELPPLGILLGSWIVAVLLVNPAGDFPLNDDFSFGRSVFNLVPGGQLRLDDWLSMPLLSQLFWGAGFCQVFGFSFTVLRISTLILGFAAVAAMYFLCRDLGQRRSIATLAALVVAFNPLFFSLSFTFMTDVPFLAFLILTTLFWGRALRGGHNWNLWAGAAFAVAAIFVRQLGLMLPVAFLAARLCQKGGRFRNVAVAAAPLAVATVLYLAFLRWLESGQGLPATFGGFAKLFSRVGEPGFYFSLLQRPGVLLLYFGIFLLPVSLAIRRPHISGRWMKAVIWVALAVFLAGAVAAWPKLPWGNVLYNFGLGPKLLKDGQFFFNVRPVLSATILTGIKLICFAGGALLLIRGIPQVIGKLKPGALRKPEAVFATTNLLLYGGFLLLDKYFFDRYFLPLLPFVLLLILPARAQKAIPQRLPLRIAAIAVAASLAIFSVMATHDYLAWNRARWAALHYLTVEKNISPSRIDGGFEFNGWHRPGKIDHESWKSWWWVDRDDFAVTFGGLRSFKKEKAFPWPRWLPPGVDSVFVLKHE